MTSPKSIRPSRANVEDLEIRVANRKQELITEIIEFKKSSRIDAAEAIERLKARLTELARLMKEGVVDGWANVGERSRTKLDAWIAR
jgi:prephenate dehydrogenase